MHTCIHLHLTKIRCSSRLVGNCDAKSIALQAPSLAIEAGRAHSHIFAHTYHPPLTPFFPPFSRTSNFLSIEPHISFTASTKPPLFLKHFGHREDDMCWWCGGTTAQTREHLFRHCRRWKEEQQELWREVGKAMGWKVSRCRNIQISELFSMETCDQAVMDFLAATDIGKFPPK